MDDALVILGIIIAVVYVGLFV